MKPESRQRIRIATVVGDRLLASAWMRRLSRVSFLGTLDHHPGCRHASTRWEHSLSVAEHAVEVAHDLELEATHARIFVAASLLHDVGHYPLSHAAEPAFARVLGEGHHGVGQWIIRGTGPVRPEASLRAVLNDEGIDADAVWGVIAGESTDPVLSQLSALLAAPLNLDTLDGIPRVVRDFRLRGGAARPARLFGFAQGELVLRDGAIEAMDAFWALKNHVYAAVINMPSNILAEARLCDLVAANITGEARGQLQELDDAWLRDRLGRSYSAAKIDVRDDLAYDLAAHADPERSMTRMQKRYFVDERVRPEGGGLPLSAWAGRYRHERQPAYLVARGKQLPLPGFSTLESPEI